MPSRQRSLLEAQGDHHAEAPYHYRSCSGGCPIRARHFSGLCRVPGRPFRPCTQFRPRATFRSSQPFRYERVLCPSLSHAPPTGTPPSSSALVDRRHHSHGAMAQPITAVTELMAMPRPSLAEHAAAFPRHTWKMARWYLPTAARMKALLQRRCPLRHAAKPLCAKGSLFHSEPFSLSPLAAICGKTAARPDDPGPC